MEKESGIAPEEPGRDQHRFDLDSQEPGLDFICIGAHPDDVEIAMAGTVLRLVAKGYRGALLDLTDGGMGTRGTAETRALEAAAAARLLGAPRHGLGLTDGFLESGRDAQLKLAAFIRKMRPKALFTHHRDDDHPDHAAACDLVLSAWFKAGLSKLPCEGEPFRPGRVFHFLATGPTEPRFCVDISPYWDRKLEVLSAYGTQFHRAPLHRAAPLSEPAPGEGGPGDGLRKTDLSSPVFLEHLEARSRFLGGRIKRRHAEGFLIRELPEVDDPLALGGMAGGGRYT